MLRKIRIVLAALFWVAVTALFLDFTGTLHAWLGWVAKIQFLPAVLALNVGVIVGLVLLTLVFGRVYCSVICPMGVFQDIVSWIHGKTNKKNRYRFSYSPAKNWMRYGMLVLFVIALVAGVGSFVALLAPYSAYGRIISNLVAPLYQLANNALAHVTNHFEHYAFYTKDVWLKSLPTFIIAIVTVVAIVILAWNNGRTYCNTICPVGTTLGLLSRFSLFGPVIDTEKCHNCGLCGKQCKAACIDMAAHKIDYSRCVDCMDCIESCKHGALKYKFRYAKKCEAKSSEKTGADAGRRAFMLGAALAVGTAAAKAQDMKVDGGLITLDKKKSPERKTKLVPAGAQSIKNLSQHCTGCQLCVSVCPNNVLRPSTSLMNLMQPEMSFERGYCRTDCNKCSQVCPAGAIRPIEVEEKTSIQIGHAVVNLDLCVVNRDGVKCGNCARHCPSGAIHMVATENGLHIPAVNVERCVGCGACEHLCPSNPISAIHVEGHEEHKNI